MLAVRVPRRCHQLQSVEPGVPWPLRWNSVGSGQLSAFTVIVQAPSLTAPTWSSLLISYGD
ncbi:hypothetical protein E2C01_021072 [Portunus trituberculatus]|uniref:Uncharacterized protein n=1 Tax=Portunus trituberculatus TaxID=210409 RepID=A0A5B7E534_PORTR|nr:hypothetical protein [Portunus trituberculatus]